MARPAAAAPPLPRLPLMNDVPPIASLASAIHSASARVRSCVAHARVECRSSAGGGADSVQRQLVHRVKSAFE